jgi:hypothetical protein
MSRVKAIFSIAALLVGTGAQGVTFAELAQKNNRLVELTVEFSIAKKEAEIADLKTRMASQGGQALAIRVPAILPAGPSATTGARAANRQEDQENSKDKEIVLNAIHGNAANPTGDFQQGNVPMTRRRGEPLFDGWVVQAIDYPEAVLVRRGQGRREQIQRLRLTAANPGR